MTNNFEGFLFHIVRYKELKIGNVLQLGGHPNNFCKKMNELSFSFNGKDVNELVLRKGVENFNENELKVLKDYVYESCMITRELVLENVRLKEFSDYPSRLECLFCTKTYEEALNWVSILKRMDKLYPPLQIVKLRCNGKIFEGDGDLMLRNTYSIGSKIEMAKKYWGGETQSNNQEILFVGRAEVVEIK